ncbi:teichuronic acid biosynthesis glycosyltransferase TuaG [Lachnospiraceae bacterium PM6-15]|uniref:glycosyltransferase family 2 protein n=1 Tax=Ohessyouella blattaphilus TaxID=2949333 RepID=UPI003E29A90D
MQDLVSILTPSYNCEKYIMDTIQSVKNQTYQNWEMIIVDDGSTDCTLDIVKQVSEGDSRIKLLCQNENCGAAKARNQSLLVAQGRYVAYLDADDKWKPQKLEKQIQFMKENGYGFSCSSYEIIDDDGRYLNKKVYMLDKVDYKGFLANNFLQTVGIMVDTKVVEKKHMIMPNIRRRQDAATWLQILRAGYVCYGMKEVLAEYRRTTNSLSSNKWKAVKGVWFLYRKIERLPFLYCCYCFTRYAFLAVWKRIYFNRKS